MSTLTPRLGLVKPATTEAYDIAIPNANMDLLDAAPANVTICTSSTRPVSPDEGDVIYETDTLNALLRQGSAWKAWNGKAFLCTSGTRPAAGAAFPGMICFETDTFHLIIRNSGNTAWLALSVAGTAPTVTQFTSPGVTVWTMPTGMVACIAEVVGAGGSGGGNPLTGAGQSAISGGGGGGGYCRKLFLASALAATETVRVGAGGAASTAGGAGNLGGLSRFAEGKAYVLLANGGAGGLAGTATSGAGPFNTAGGAGGTASGGDLNITGGAGNTGTAISGGGICVNFGGGSGEGYAMPTSSPVNVGNGFAGNLYGGGSSGCVSVVTAAQASQAGASGMVMVTHLF